MAHLNHDAHLFQKKNVACSPAPTASDFQSSRQATLLGQLPVLGLRAKVSCISCIATSLKEASATEPPMSHLGQMGSCIRGNGTGHSKTDQYFASDTQEIGIFLYYIITSLEDWKYNRMPTRLRTQLTPTAYNIQF